MRAGCCETHCEFCVETGTRAAAGIPTAPMGLCFATPYSDRETTARARNARARGRALLYFFKQKKEKRFYV